MRQGWCKRDNHLGVCRDFRNLEEDNQMLAGETGHKAGLLNVHKTGLFSVQRIAVTWRAVLENIAC